MDCSGALSPVVPAPPDTRVSPGQTAYLHGVHFMVNRRRGSHGGTSSCLSCVTTDAHKPVLTEREIRHWLNVVS